MKRNSQHEDDSDNPDNEPSKRQKEDLELSQIRDFPLESPDNERCVGSIERIYMKNFMCHSKLDVNFYPQVNFVIGRNGSGKSAILTALVVGLGGKANVTNRGTSVKSFIKSGKQNAEVSIQLYNKGLDAYKHHLYGDHIIVERKLTADGSHYKLKSESNKVVSMKREELSHILDQFNIQVDNPISILNQDTSRNFLHSKSANDKYKFFLKATQLEQIKVDYIHAEEQKTYAEEILRQKKETMPSLEKEVQNWEMKYKALHSLSAQKKKVNELKDEMAWAFVHEVEIEVEEATKGLKIEEARLPKFVQKVNESQRSLEALNQKYSDKQEELTQMSKEAIDLEPQHFAKKQELDEKKKFVRKIHKEVTGVSAELATHLKEKAQLVEKISEINSVAQQDYEAERIAKSEKIAQLEAQNLELKMNQDTIQTQIDQFFSASEKSKGDISHYKQSEGELTMKIKQASMSIIDLEASKKNKMHKYGNWMPNLLKAIEESYERGVFHRKPVGPIGANICLKDQKWALAVEICLKSFIRSFCVNDHDDEKELEKLFKRFCPNDVKPQTITSKFQSNIYNVSANVPHTSNFPTVLNILKIEDAVVANCLIDHRSIESILLIEDNTTARNIMSKSGIKNCREAFTMSGDQLYSQPMFRYYSSQHDKAQFLSASVDDDIKIIKEDEKRYRQELVEVKDNLSQIQKSVSFNYSQQKSLQNKHASIRDQISRLNFDVRELKSKEDPAPINVTLLEEEVVRYNENIQELTGSKTILETEEKDAKIELDNITSEYNFVSKAMQKITDGLDPIKAELSDVETKIESSKQTKRHYDLKLSAHQKTIDAASKVVAEIMQKLESSTGTAKKISERKITKRTPRSIESEIQQILKRIKLEEKNRGNAEEITRRYNETFDSYKKITRIIQQINNFLNELSKVVQNRQHQYKSFLRMIALRAKYYFIVMLSNRQYQGKLMFDHKKETLTMSVHPVENLTNGTNTVNPIQDVKSLSGGERSFATVCFILALWDAMESPFRCLDEFDVFMDMVNRRISMELMMDRANHHKSHQFIFFTPQDMSFMFDNPSIHIFKMPDPERGQLTLTQMQEADEDKDTA